jgi:hypothetical protein
MQFSAWNQISDMSIGPGTVCQTAVNSGNSPQSIVGSEHREAGEVAAKPDCATVALCPAHYNNGCLLLILHSVRQTVRLCNCLIDGLTRDMVPMYHAAVAGAGT